MATNYTSLLGFALPTTGELAGTWGNVVNDSITQLVEDSVAGTASVSVTAGDVTLTTTGSGAANQARCAIIIATGTPGTARNIIAPSSSKAYIVINQSDSNIVFKGAATTGHTLKPGDANLIAWNGSDFIDIEQGDLTGPASATDNAVARFDGTTGKLVQNSAVTIADTTGDIETSGKLVVGAGTASLPSLTFSSDTNNGIFAPAADNIGFATSGSEAMRINSSGDLGLGTATPDVFSTGFARNLTVLTGASSSTAGVNISGTSASRLQLGVGSTRTFYLYSDSSNFTELATTTNLPLRFSVNNAAKLSITTAGFTQPVAYADTVVAIGNTSTAATITLTSGNVFTATLTGNCTFTLSAPIATGASSFTLILTNDGTAGRTVAWSGGTFLFPGGASALSRTTTANATDIWAFFTPNGGTTWYGNIVMKDVKA